MSRIPFVTEGVLDIASDINSSLVEADGIITSRIVDFVTEPPSGVSDKARYGISAGASGAFAGKDGQIGIYVAEGDFWNFYSPLHVFQNDMLYVSNGFSWTPVEGRLENKGKVVQTKGQSIYDVMSQKSVTDELNTKADTSYADTELSKKVDKVEGQSLFKDTERTKLSGIATEATKNRSDAEMDVIWNTKVDKVAGKELSDTNFTQVEKTKLSGVAVGATKNATDAQLRDRASHTGEQPISTVTSLQSTLDSKVDKIEGKGLSTSDFTPAEKAKLASLESSKYRGSYPSLADLQAANPNPSAGEYADVDSGEGKDASRWIWDNSDNKWVDLGAAPALTPAQVKELYEENADTNAFTDAEKTKLSGIAAGSTKNATDAQLRARASHTGVQAISTVTGLQAGLDSKVDKVDGKELSANDFTNVLKTKLDSLPSGVGGLIPLSAGGTGATTAATARTALQLGNASTRNFGTAVNTVMMGNDSRANNGQTAFSWGNHASAGYALEQSLVRTVGEGFTLADGKLDLKFGTTAGTVVVGNDSRVNNGQAAFNRLNIGATAATARTALELGAGATRWPKWAEVTSKPSTFTPSSHTHPWSQVTGQPATATRWPTFAEVTGKPSTYAPSGHTHPWSQITGQPAQATRWPTFAEVTGKPSTYAPSGHTHPVSQITGLGTAATMNVGTAVGQVISNSDASLMGAIASASTGGGSTGFWEITLPYKANAGRMLSFQIKEYSSYNHSIIDVSGYLYSQPNNWYSPQCTITSTGTNTPTVRFGRNAAGNAVIVVSTGQYSGIGIYNVVSGYSNTVNLHGTTITRRDTLPNHTYIASDTLTHYHTGNMPETATRWPTFAEVTGKPVGAADPWPVGACYTQYPDTPAPATLFGGTWKQLFNNEGVFFRTEGGGASSFGGGVQGDDNKSHTHTASTNSTGAHTHTLSGTAASAGGHTHTISSNSQGSTDDHRTAGISGRYHGTQGTFSNSTNSGGAHTHSISGTAASSGAHSHTVTVAASGGTEARPTNRTIRVWQRTA